jgi:redox-sensing transcriptional repressor
VAGLTGQIERTLGAHEVHPVALVGVGHLGSALAGYSGFSGRGFPIGALFDEDPRKIGTVVAGHTVRHIDRAGEVCQAAAITIGVIATPAGAAQRVADVLVAAGVRSILNFAPARLELPGDVEVRRVDVALELQMLAFHETRRAESYADLAATS